MVVKNISRECRKLRVTAELMISGFACWGSGANNKLVSPISPLLLDPLTYFMHFTKASWKLRGAK